MNTVQLQPVFILHTRPYRDTSLLVDALSQDYGRISLVARGQRSGKQRSRSPIYPFAELLLSWRSKSELKTLTDSDCIRQYYLAPGWVQFSALYINELLIRLLPQHDEHRDIFQLYRDYLGQLAALPSDDTTALEALLRRFELNLLDHLGYGISFFDADSGAPLEPQFAYRYSADHGFSVVGELRNSLYFAGVDLLAIAADDYTAQDTLRAAKRLLRQTLAQHLGGKPLRSRELFAKFNTDTDNR